MHAITFYLFAELLMQATAASWLLVAELRRAPEGYEDATGFHLLPTSGVSPVLDYVI